jgi:hypothetical protein
MIFKKYLKGNIKFICDSGDTVGTTIKRQGKRVFSPYGQFLTGQECIEIAMKLAELNSGAKNER